MNNIDLIGDDACVKQLVAGDFSNTNGVYIDDRVERIGGSAFYSCSNLTSVDFPVATSIGGSAFYSCSYLTSVNFPAATSIGGNAFYSCSNLTSVDFPVATSIGGSAFYGCSALTSVDFPAATNIGVYAFRGCYALTSVDFPVATKISGNAFQSCSHLTSLILRKSNSICTLSNISAFNSTPINSGTGYIYVPRALMDTYKAASNWSTYANQFRALEDYTIDGTITGELDPSKI